MELTHLSYSSISSYLTCGRSWKYKYIDKVPTPKSGELFFGSVFHSAIEKYVVKSTLPLLDLWQLAWNNELEKNEQIAWGDNSPETLFNEGIRILSNKEVLNTLNTIKPLIEPDGPVIEKKIELHIPGVPLPIVGYIDLIQSDGIPVDFKTSSRSWTADRADSELQPTFYLAGLNQMGFKIPSNRFRYFVFVKNKTPKVDIFETKRTIQDMFWLFEMIREVYEGIKKEVYVANPSTYLCDPKYCAYWQDCRGKK